MPLTDLFDSTMDLIQQQLVPTVSESALTLLIQNIVVTFMAEYFCVCVIRSNMESHSLKVPTPSMVISVDSNFERSFQRGIDAGCQAFIVQSQSLWPFLNSFIPVHDISDQRFSGKKLIVMLESLDIETTNSLCRHPALRDLPDVLIIVSQNGSVFELYTTHICSNGFEDSPNVEIVPIIAPNYFPDKSKDLEQITIRFSPVLYPPFSYYGNTTIDKANAWYTSSNASDVIPMIVDGQESLFLVEFCHKYNCSIKVVYDNDSWGEVFENQTGTGSLGTVAMHKADIAVGAIYYWLGPYKFGAFTAPLSRSGLTVVVPKPIIQAPWKTPFLSFPVPLWIAVAVSFVLGVFFIWFVEKARVKILRHSTQNATSLSDAALLVIGLFIEQGVDTRRRGLASSTLLLVFMLFAGFMIGNMYNAGLASVMTIPQYAKSIDTTRDLAASGLPWGGTALAWIFAIWTASEEYLTIIVNNYHVVEQETLISNAKSGNFGFVGERTEFGHFVPIDYLDEESSQLLRLLKDDLAWETCVALVSKTCPFKPRLDELIMNIRQSGVQFYWELMASNKYLNMTHEKNILNGRQTNTEEEAKRLTVLHFIGAYLILGSGFIGGSILFVLELLFSKLRKQK